MKPLYFAWLITSSSCLSLMGLLVTPRHRPIQSRLAVHSVSSATEDSKKSLLQAMSSLDKKRAPPNVVMSTWESLIASHNDSRTVVDKKALKSFMAQCYKKCQGDKSKLYRMYSLTKHIDRQHWEALSMNIYFKICFALRMPAEIISHIGRVCYMQLGQSKLRGFRDGVPSPLLQDDFNNGPCDNRDGENNLFFDNTTLLILVQGFGELKNLQVVEELYTFRSQFGWRPTRDREILLHNTILGILLKRGTLATAKNFFVQNMLNPLRLDWYSFNILMGHFSERGDLASCQRIWQQARKTKKSMNAYNAEDLGDQELGENICASILVKLLLQAAPVATTLEGTSSVPLDFLRKHPSPEALSAMLYTATRTSVRQHPNRVSGGESNSSIMSSPSLTPQLLPGYDRASYGRLIVDVMRNFPAYPWAFNSSRFRRLVLAIRGGKLSEASSTGSIELEATCTWGAPLSSLMEAYIACDEPALAVNAYLTVYSAIHNEMALFPSEHDTESHETRTSTVLRSDQNNAPALLDEIRAIPERPREIDLRGSTRIFNSLLTATRMLLEDFFPRRPEPSSKIISHTGTANDSRRDSDNHRYDPEEVLLLWNFSRSTLCSRVFGLFTVDNSGARKSLEKNKQYEQIALFDIHTIGSGIELCGTVGDAELASELWNTLCSPKSHLKPDAYSLHSYLRTFSVPNQYPALRRFLQTSFLASPFSMDHTQHKVHKKEVIPGATIQLSKFLRVQRTCDEIMNALLRCGGLLDAVAVVSTLLLTHASTPTGATTEIPSLVATSNLLLYYEKISRENKASSSDRKGTSTSSVITSCEVIPSVVYQLEHFSGPDGINLFASPLCHLKRDNAKNGLDSTDIDLDVASCVLTDLMVTHTVQLLKQRAQQAIRRGPGSSPSSITADVLIERFSLLFACWAVLIAIPIRGQRWRAVRLAVTAMTELERSAGLPAIKGIVGTSKSEGVASQASQTVAFPRGRVCHSLPELFIAHSIAQAIYFAVAAPQHSSSAAILDIGNCTGTAARNLLSTDTKGKKQERKVRPRAPFSDTQARRVALRSGALAALNLTRTTSEVKQSTFLVDSIRLFDVRLGDLFSRLLQFSPIQTRTETVAASPRSTSSSSENCDIEPVVVLLELLASTQAIFPSLLPQAQSIPLPVSNHPPHPSSSAHVPLSLLFSIFDEVCAQREYALGARFIRTLNKLNIAVDFDLADMISNSQETKNGAMFDRELPAKEDSVLKGSPFEVLLGEEDDPGSGLRSSSSQFWVDRLARRWTAVLLSSSLSKLRNRVAGSTVQAIALSSSSIRTKFVGALSALKRGSPAVGVDDNHE